MSPMQIEHAPTFTGPLPAQDTLARLKELCRHHDSEIMLAKRLRVAQGSTFARQFSQEDRDWYTNQLTQCELRQRELLDELINVARQLVAEADIAEILEETQ